MKKNLAGLGPFFLATGIVVLGAVLGWISFMEWDSFRSRAEELLQRKQESVLALPGGVEKINQEISLQKKSREQLAKALETLLQPGTEAWGTGQAWATDPGQWKDRLIEANDRVRQETGFPGKNGRVVLPQEFYLGFENYRQKSPTAEEVPDLARQLSVSQRLLDHLLASRQVVSEPFPTPCVVGTWRVPGIDFGSAADIPSAEKKTTKDSVQLQKPRTHVRETYEITMECSPEILRDFLSRLIRDPWIFIPTQLKIENELASFPKRAEFEKTFSPSPGAALGGGESVVTPGKSPLLLVLAGKEKLRVFLRVDFAAWPPPAQPENAPPERGKAGS